MLRTIAEHLAADGHNVDVLTAQPSYGGSALHDRVPRTEDLKGVSVTRLPLLDESKKQPVRRVANLCLFSAQVSAHILRNSYDVVMAATTPPVLVAYCARLATQAKRGKFIYHMQDIYPEVLSANAGRPLGIPSKLLRRLDRVTSKNADRVVVLSRDMRSALESRGHSVEHVRLINNFMPDSSHGASLPTEDTTRAKEGSFQVIFAGNLGRFQGLHALIDAFKILNETAVEAHLVLLGDGAALEELQEQAGELAEDTIFFRGRTSQANAEAAVRVSDLAIVTLNPGVIETAFPSKTMTYLSSGTEVLATVEQASELGELLIENGVGTTSDLTAESIARSVRDAVNRPRIPAKVIEEIALDYGSSKSRLPQWSSLFVEQM